MTGVPKARVWLATAAVVVSAAGGGTAYWDHWQDERQARDRAEATRVAEAFLAAWAERRYPDLNTLTAGVDDPAGAYRATDGRLRTERVVVTPGPLDASGRRVPFTAVLTLAGLGELRVASEVEVAPSLGGWKVVFRSRTLHPALGNGQRLDLESTPGGRGEVLDRKGRPLARSADLAANVVGRPGTGLQRVLDARLTGTSGSRVVVRDATSGAVVSVVQEFPAKPPEGVRTTLDLDVQRAAEAALAGVPSRATVVVVHAPTGEVRAIANRPVAGAPAHAASYAPGSVFKVVTATALLQRGVRPGTRVGCPATTSSGGRVFRNDDEKDLGTVTFARAFAESCNTSFLELAEDLPPSALQQAAALYGFGRDDLLPVRVESGQVPDPASTAEAAAAVIGQGRVEASPLLVASMAAAVSTGTWRQPRLLPGRGDSRALPAGVAPALRSLMRLAVASGTGRAAQGPGPAVSGKTGTAQYGDGTLSHAWFAGYRGELALAVFVETGASGGSTAAPVARRLLAALPG